MPIVRRIYVSPACRLTIGQRCSWLAVIKAQAVPNNDVLLDAKP
jgi:hypothetical protein